METPTLHTFDATVSTHVDELVATAARHGLPAYTLAGRAYAHDEYFDRSRGEHRSDPVDITEWSISELYRWLGY